MKKLTGNQIRQMWLDFFASKGHEVVPSASLIPVNDPTLLWINAGVAPLKKYFDGREVPKNKRMENGIVIIILTVIVVGIVWYLLRAKKRGENCIGCPYAKQCKGKCSQSNNGKNNSDNGNLA